MRVFSWALEKLWGSYCPALPMRREFGKFLRTLLTHENCQPMTGLAARLAVLTWSWPVELRTARWEHFDLEAKEWRVSAANMRDGKHLQAHMVPLSAQALLVLDKLRALNGERVQWLFPGNHGADSIMSENTSNLLFEEDGLRGKAEAPWAAGVGTQLAVWAGLVNGGAGDAVGRCGPKQGRGGLCAQRASC
jgi:integrase